ncbi:MAG: restriction endonuclease [Candidatus Hydrogenedentota bacterium]
MTFIALLVMAAIVLMGLALYFSGQSAVTAAKQLDAKGDRAGSIALLAREIHDHPENVAARRLLADLLERDGRHEEALEHATEILFSLTPSELDEGAREFDPHDIVNAGLQCARIASHLNKMQEAFLALERCRAAATKLDRVSRAAFLRVHSQAAESCGDSSTAIELYRELESIMPLDATEHLLFGKLLTRMQQWEESIAHLKIAREATHNDPAVARLLAQAHTNAGDHHEAWAIYKPLFAERPNFDRIILVKEYVTTLDQVGNIAGAIDVIEQVIRYPEAGPELQAELICMIGDMLEKSEKPEEARREWRRALVHLPNYAPACRRLGIRPKPTNTAELIQYVRGLSEENFSKLFEKILVDWGYTIERVIAFDRDSMDLAVKRPEESKMLRKLVRIKRWENQVGKFPLEDLRIDVVEQRYDGGVYIVVSQFSAEAMIDARRAGNIELFAGAELVDLVARIELPHD